MFLKIKGIRKSYGTEENRVEVLKGIDLEVEKGQICVLLGQSGSGKSTFLRCLNLLEEPTSGEIIFEGKNITDKKIDINKTREKMGMVFQHFNLFPHKTVLENITLAPIKVKGVKVEDANKKNNIKIKIQKDISILNRKINHR